MNIQWGRVIPGLMVVSVGVVLLTPWGFDEKWMNALSAAGTVAAAWAAVWAIHEIRQDRLSRFEPFVLFDIEATNNGVYWMVLENMGAGIALDVELAFDPVPIDYNGVPIDERPLLQHPIPMIGPGKRILMFFHTNPLLYQRDVPRAFQVHVKYEGEAGFRDDRTYEFDFNKRKGQVFPPKSTSEEIHELNRHVEKLAKAIDRHSPLSGGFLVEDWASYQRRLEQQVQERRQLREDDGGGTDSVS